MKNRAKCKLCGDIIESFHPSDYVNCKCGEIGVGAGLAMQCSANDWKNFLRVDDEGNEIVVTLKEEESPFLEKAESPPPNRAELINMLDEMRQSLDNLPAHALYQNVTHADLSSLISLLWAIFKSENEPN